MIAKATWKEVKLNFGAKARITAVYVFMLAVSLLLNILFPFSIIITIPFIVLPFTFCYIATLGSTQFFKDTPVSAFFIFYPVYFKQEFFGSFRALIGFLKSLLSSFVFSTLIYIILYVTYLKIQPGFAEILTEIEAAKTMSEIETAMQHLVEFKPAYFVIQTSTFVGGFFGVWTFLHHCLLNSEKICVNLLHNKGVPAKSLHVLYKEASSMRRKEFYKEYLSSNWYVILFFLFTFGGATALSIYVFNLDGTRSIFIGLFVSLILLIPFIPYYFLLIKNLCVASTDDYQKAMINLGEKALEELKQKNQMSNEEISKLEDELAKQKEAVAEMEKQLKEEEENEKK